MWLIGLLIKIEAINFEFTFLHVKFLLWYPLDIESNIVREAENAIVFGDLFVNFSAIDLITTQIFGRLFIEVSPLPEA